MIKYIRSSVAIDGLITRFAPGFDVGRHLEVVCDRYLKWQVQRDRFAFDTLVNWSSSSRNLIHDGALRASTFFQRIATGELPIQVELNTLSEKRDISLRQRAVQMAVIVFSVSLLMVITGETVEFGINLFTVETLFIAAAAITLLRTIRRLF